MIRSILVVLFTAIVPFNLIGAEPSAFGAGDLDNPKPYGLTPSEKVALENKNNLRKVVVKSNNQANEVESLRERIDGLQSIVESLSRKSQANKIELQNLIQKNNEDLNNASEYEKRLNEINQANSESIEKIKVTISELSKVLDTINANFVTKDEFNSLVDEVNKLKSLMVKDLQTKSSPKKSKLEDMQKADIAKDAQAFYDKKYYTNAIEYYTYLIEKNYKPAYAHYMIGEMKYKRKDYAEAISYFKKSSLLYDKASYMPSLMLHTAISMDKTGDSKNAKAFYNAIISKYNNTEYANDAKKYLDLMK